MSKRVIEVDPFDLIVFGGTSDLAFRKLIPALFHRDIDGQIPKQARIIGVSRKQLSDQEYQKLARQAYSNIQVVKIVMTKNLIGFFHDYTLFLLISRPNQDGIT